MSVFSHSELDKEPAVHWIKTFYTSVSRPNRPPWQHMHWTGPGFKRYLSSKALEDIITHLQFISVKTSNLVVHRSIATETQALSTTLMDLTWSASTEDYTVVAEATSKRSKILVLRDSDQKDNSKKLSLLIRKDGSTQTISYQRMILKYFENITNLPDEILLSILKPEIENFKHNPLFDRPPPGPDDWYDLPAGRDCELDIFANCTAPRPYHLYFDKPEICTYNPMVDSLVTCELLATKWCIINIDRCDLVGLNHLWHALREVVQKTNGRAKNIDIVFLQHDKCHDSSFAELITLLSVCQEFAPYLSGNVKFHSLHWKVWHRGDCPNIRRCPGCIQPFPGEGTVGAIEGSVVEYESREQYLMNRIVNLAKSLYDTIGRPRRSPKQIYRCVTLIDQILSSVDVGEEDRKFDDCLMINRAAHVITSARLRPEDVGTSPIYPFDPRSESYCACLNTDWSLREEFYKDHDFDDDSLSEYPVGNDGGDVSDVVSLVDFWENAEQTTENAQGDEATEVPEDGLGEETRNDQQPVEETRDHPIRRELRRIAELEYYLRHWENAEGLTSWRWHPTLWQLAWKAWDWIESLDDGWGGLFETEDHGES